MFVADRDWVFGYLTLWFLGELEVTQGKMALPLAAIPKTGGERHGHRHMIRWPHGRLLLPDQICRLDNSSVLAPLVTPVDPSTAEALKAVNNVALRLS